MKIITNHDRNFRRYKTAQGLLSIPKDRQPVTKVFPAVMGGHVGVEVNRKQAADGLRQWRATV